MQLRFLKKLSICICALALFSPSAFGEDVRILTPASLGAVAPEIEALWSDQLLPLRFIIGPTSQLVRQAGQGLPAHILITANKAWMDDAVKRGLIDPHSPSAFVTNSMVLAGTAPAQISLSTLKGEGRIAMCGPGPVPCGVYVRSALEKLGLWEAIKPQIVYAKDAAGARHFIESGVVDMGFIYKSDAHQSQSLHILAPIDPALSGAVVYQIATLKAADQSTAREAKAFLTSPAVLTLLKKAGFNAPEDGS